MHEILLVVESALGANDFVDRSPVGQAADIPVVNVDVRNDLGAALAGEQGSARLVAVDGIEVEPPVVAELDGRLQKFAFARSPENQAVAFLLKLTEGFDGERFFFANLRISTAMVMDYSLFSP